MEQSQAYATMHPDPKFIYIVGITLCCVRHSEKVRQCVNV